MQQLVLGWYYLPIYNFRINGREAYETLHYKRGPTSVFRTISPKCPTNDMLQSPWPWWNSVHFRASKQHRTRRSVWPIGEEGWTLPALTSPTWPDPPHQPPTQCPAPHHYPTPPIVHFIHPSIHPGKQPVSQFRLSRPSVATKNTRY